METKSDVSWYHRWRTSRPLAVAISFIALFLDGILVTAIVPIMPDYLFKITQCQVNREASNFESCLNNISRNYTEIQNEYLVTQNSRLGLMFGSKFFVELLTNPFAGILCTKIGYTIPMFIGFIIMFSSTMSFAFAQTYIGLFISRAMQGFGSSFTAVAGMTMLCDRYKESDEKRGKAIGIAGSGLSLGLSVGPVYGGTLYTYFGMKVPFLILAGLTLFDGLLRISIISRTDSKLSKQSNVKKSVSSFRLLLDPYIAICFGSLLLGTIGVASLETMLPTWMNIKFHSNPSIQGLAFLSLSITLFISGFMFSWLSFKIGRWLCAMLGLILMTVSLLLIPLSKSIYYTCFINCGVGFAVGMIATPLLPLIIAIGDLRYASAHANLPAIGVSAFCVSYSLGPIFSGYAVKLLSFQWTLYIIAILCLIYSPLLLFLRNIPPLKPEMSDESRVSEEHDCE